MDTDRIRVLIADDQRLFAGSLKTVLEGFGSEQIHVVGIAYDGREAVELVESLAPDVVLMDVRMPVMDGVEATRVVRDRFPGVKVMILTTFDDDDYVHDALANGAVGYVLKNIEPQELVTCVKAVCAGTFLMSRSVGAKLVSQATPEHSGAKLADAAAEANFLLHQFPGLSRREAEVLYLLAQNLDNREIASRLFIADQTAKNYVSKIYEKLGVPDRIHALRLIRERRQGS
jgi:DNA-binding NarL/FixJ family response regulator